MRIRLRGINSVKKKLADGSIRIFYYAWKSGPRLRGEPGTPEFTASYNEACTLKVKTPAGTLLSLLQRYQSSEDFRPLAELTRRSYVALIKRIEQRFSDFPLSALSDRRTRGLFMDWRDKIAINSGRRQADYAWTVLALILAWGVDRGIISTNPCERGGRLYRGSRSEKVWSDADEAAFLERAPPHLHLPLMLALWTGQSQGDLLRLPWSAYDGMRLHFRRRRKTGALIPPIPAGTPLRTMLDATSRKSPIILVNSNGEPWTSDGFRASWRKACNAAGVSDVTFHDLRGTAVTRLALVGCTEIEIATLTGHSLRAVRGILDVHYLNRDPALAASAIAKLERRTKTPN